MELKAADVGSEGSQLSRYWPIPDLLCCCFFECLNNSSITVVWTFWKHMKSTLIPLEKWLLEVLRGKTSECTARQGALVRIIAEYLNAMLIWSNSLPTLCVALVLYMPWTSTSLFEQLRSHERGSLGCIDLTLFHLHLHSAVQPLAGMDLTWCSLTNFAGSDIFTIPLCVLPSHYGLWMEVQSFDLSLDRCLDDLICIFGFPPLGFFWGTKEME